VYASSVDVRALTNVYITLATRIMSIDPTSYCVSNGTLCCVDGYYSMPSVTSSLLRLSFGSVFWLLKLLTSTFDFSRT